jgi:hypothetical protein
VTTLLGKKPGVLLREIHGISSMPAALCRDHVRTKNVSITMRRPKKNKAEVADNLARACNLDCHANVREG